MTTPILGSGWSRAVVRVAALCVAVAGFAFALPAAVGASGSAPASVSFDPELLGSWGAIGNTLSVDPGAWTGNPSSIAARWFHCDGSGANCGAIGGATGLDYTLVAADAGRIVYAKVTATNAVGSSSIQSYGSGVVGAPTVASEPVISGDANVDGTTLSVSQGSWTGSPTSYAYQWSSCDGVTLACSPIPGADSSTFLVSLLALNGKYLEVDVTATNADGSADNGLHESFAIGKAHTDLISSGAITGVPTDVVRPTLTGDASQVGNVLVGDPGVWTNHPSSFSYLWEHCDQMGCTPILGSGMSSLTYTIQSSDAGHYIDFMVDAFNVDGQSSRDGNGGSLVNNTYVSDDGNAGAPEPLLPPQLTGDATGAGSVIQVTPVKWSAPQDPNVTVTYQWVRCDGADANCFTIDGATSSSYTLTGADLGQTIYAVVDGQNSWGTTALVTTTITPPIGAPANGDQPIIAGDTSGSGETLTVSDGTWVNDPTSFQYQWYSCDSNRENCNAIPSATGANYQTTPGDIGNTLIAEVDATNGQGTTTAFSPATDPIGAPYATIAPELTSTNTLLGDTPVAELGDTLSVDQGTWNGSPTSISYQWFRCDPSSPTKSDFTNCNAIAGATSQSYITVNSDLGHTVYVEIDATNGAGTSSAYANPGGSVGVPQPLLDDGSIDGSAQVGQTLTFVNSTSWEGDTPITWRYLWDRCDSSGNNCALIPGATADTYTLVPADQGAVIKGEIFGSNTWGGNGVGLYYDTAVVTGASGGGATGGGGGGGGGGPLDLATSVSASPTQIAPGGSAIFHIVVTDVTKIPATHLHVTVTLPAGAAVASTSADRGQGCKTTATAGVLSCDLDYLAGSPTVGNITITLTLPQAGQATLTATAAADQTEANTANNTASATVQVGTPAVPPPPTPPPLPPPLLKQLNSRTLTGITHGTTETVNGRITTNEAVRLTMSVTKLRTTKRLTLGKNSSLAGKTTRRPSLALMRSVTHAGTYSYRAILSRNSLAKGTKYTIRLTATNANHKTKTLTIPFRA